MSAYHGRSLDLPNLLSFDMGGTTAKGALVRGGVPIKRYAMEVARVHEFRKGSGLAIRIPAIDMIEIGAGGGSIAEIDERGLLRVGPRSAGADPGPACYGRGGTRPTLTDANLVLGYLDAGFFLGGAMALDRRGGGDRRPRRRGQALGTRDAARGLGHPRHRQRGRRARLPHPRQRARLRLPLGQHGGVRRLGPAARAGHRAQAQDPARDLPGRRRRHVGARLADQPAGLRGGALAAHPRRRHRCCRFRRDLPGIGERGEVVPAERGRGRARYSRQAAPRHALPGAGPRDRGDAAGCGRSRRPVRRSRGAVRARLRGGLHAAPRRAGGDRQLEGRGGGTGPEPRHRLRAVGTGRDGEGEEGRSPGLRPRQRADDGVAGLRQVRARPRRSHHRAGADRGAREHLRDRQRPRGDRRCPLQSRCRTSTHDSPG